MSEAHFRRVLALVVLVALGGAGGIAGQETPPTLVYDFAHHTHPPSGPISGLLEVAEAEGFRVRISRDQEVTSAAADVLVIADALPIPRGEFFERFGEPDASTAASSPIYWDPNARASAFGPEEIEGILAWVRRGGGLLLIADHAPFGGAASALAAAFGVEVRNAFTTDFRSPPGYLHRDESSERSGYIYFSRDNGGLGSHPVLEGARERYRVEAVVTYVGTSLIGPPDATPILRLSPDAEDFTEATASGTAGRASASGRSQAVALDVGDGRVFVLGETAAMMTAPFGKSHPRDPEGLGMGLDYELADNRSFARNILLWLADRL